MVENHNLKKKKKKKKQQQGNWYMKEYNNIL